MNFSWSHFHVDPTTNRPAREQIEESFEDPFGIRLIPEGKVQESSSRGIMLGRSYKGQGVFSVYRSVGNDITVISSRWMSSEEETFYERQKQQNFG